MFPYLPKSRQEKVTLRQKPRRLEYVPRLLNKTTFSSSFSAELTQVDKMFGIQFFATRVFPFEEDRNPKRTPGI